MRLFHAGLRRASKPVGALVLTSVFASGLLLAPTPAVAQESTAIAISPYRQTRAPGQVATVNISLAAGSKRLASVPVTFWTRPTTTTTWTKYVTKSTSGTGTSGISFAARVSTYVRVTYDGDARYAASASGSAGVVVSAPLGSKAVQEASRHNGKPYQWGAVGPSRFDCSGFTLYVFSRFGKRLPHNSTQQYQVVRHVARSSMQVGDLIFTGSSPSTIGHVGIYAGNGYMWHSPHSGSTVQRSKIWATNYYVGRVA